MAFEKIGKIAESLVERLKVKETGEIKEILWTGEHFFFPQAMLEKFRRLYPFFDRELIKAELWYLANPKKQKKNHYRFLLNWMRRHENPNKYAR